MINPNDDDFEAELAREDIEAGEQVTYLKKPRSYITGETLRALPPEAMDSIVSRLLLLASSAREERFRASEAEVRLAESLDLQHRAHEDRDRLVSERVELSTRLREALTENANLKVLGEEGSQAVGLLSLAIGLLLEVAPQDPRLPDLLFQAARIGVGVSTPLLLQKEVASPALGESAVVLAFPRKHPSPALPAPDTEIPKE